MRQSSGNRPACSLMTDHSSFAKAMVYAVFLFLISVPNSHATIRPAKPLGHVAARDLPSLRSMSEAAIEWAHRRDAISPDVPPPAAAIVSSGFFAAQPRERLPIQLKDPVVVFSDNQQRGSLNVRQSRGGQIRTAATRNDRMDRIGMGAARCNVAPRA